jgi:hypothetical protein
MPETSSKRDNPALLTSIALSRGVCSPATITLSRLIAASAFRAAGMLLWKLGMYVALRGSIYLVHKAGLSDIRYKCEPAT